MLVAAHAAVSECPRCGGRVRSGVEIQADVADLEDLVMRTDRLRVSPYEDDRELHELVMFVVARCFQALRAEAAGEHFACGSSPAAYAALLEVARRRVECEERGERA